MTRVLLVGYDPRTEDFSNPGYPPGLSADKIEAGIDIGVGQMRARGWDVDVHRIRFQDAPEAAGAKVESQLRSAAYDCVVMGGGIRIQVNYLMLEAIINAVHSGAPAAAIALNAGPEDSANAAERRLKIRQQQPEAH